MPFWLGGFSCPTIALQGIGIGDSTVCNTCRELLCKAFCAGGLLESGASGSMMLRLRTRVGGDQGLLRFGWDGSGILRPLGSDLPGGLRT